LKQKLDSIGLIFTNQTQVAVIGSRDKWQGHKNFAPGLELEFKNPHGLTLVLTEEHHAEP